MASNIDIIIQAQDKSSSAFNSASGSLSSLNDRVESLQPTFERMAAVGTVAFGAITAVAVKSVQAYADVEKANRQLEHAVVGVSKGTKEQVEQIQKVTGALQAKAGVDADSLNMGVAQLSTFGLQTSSVIGLTKSLADLTVNQSGLNSTSEQYISSANTIAKALNGQFGVLEKSGIRFTALQQEMIKTGTEAEKVAAINEGLAQNLRETTDTVAGTDLAMARFHRTLEDASEGIGKSLAPMMNKLLEYVTPLLQKFNDWAEANPDLLAKIVLVGGGIAGLVAIVGALGLILPSIIAGFGLLSGPVGIIAGTIGILVAGFMALKDHLGGIMTFLENTGLLDYFRTVWDNISATFNETLVPAFSRLWETLVKMKPLFEAIAIVIGGALLAAIMVFAKVLEITIKLLAGLFDIGTRVAAFLVDQFTKAFDGITRAVTWLIDKFNALVSAIQSVVRAAEKIGGNVLGAISGAVSRVFNVNDAVVSPSGNIISTHPDDYLIATKDPSSLVGGGGVTINMNGGTYLDPNVALQIGDMIMGNLKLNMRGA